MSQIVDNLIAFRVLRLLTMNFNETAAFKLGIIDDKGNVLKPIKDLRTTEEKDAYSMLHRMVFRLKRILAKAPGGESKLTSFAAAYWLVKESIENDKENKNIEHDFLHLQQTGVLCVEEYLIVKQFMKENVVKEEVPTNSMAGGDIAITSGSKSFNFNKKRKKRSAREWLTARKA
jgi:hypothetical protein